MSIPEASADVIYHRIIDHDNMSHYNDDAASRRMAYDIDIVSKRRASNNDISPRHRTCDNDISPRPKNYDVEIASESHASVSYYDQCNIL